MKKRTVVMIGDSITEGFDTDKYFPGETIINRGVSGDSTVECLGRITEEWFEGAPDLVFLCIGTNDLARERTDECILMNIEKIVESIKRSSRNASIYVTSIFPTRENAPRPNDRIRDLNEHLRKLSADLGCLYLDLHQHFTDDHGMLRSEFTDDGLHLTEEGYRHWYGVLSELLMVQQRRVEKR